MRPATLVALARQRLSWVKPFFPGIAFLAFTLWSAFCIGHAQAQTYPNKPIRIIIPFSAGGVADTLIRRMSPMVSPALGQPILIDNRPGASEQITLSACARAAPDGYTICMSTGTGMSFGPLLFSNLPYDTERDFAPITNLVLIPGVIAANKDVPFNSVNEMIAYAKGKPGVLNMGSWGVASPSHIYLEWIKNQTGVDIVHVPYKGGGNPVIVAMVAGDVQVTYMAVGLILSQIKAGKIRAIAVTTPQRSRHFPTVRTLAEDGLDPGFSAWFGLLAPAATPKPIIDLLNAEYVKVLRHSGFQEGFLAAAAYDAAGSSPAEFAAFMKTDRQHASRVVKLIGLQPATVDSSTKAPDGPASGKP